jgi:hypothetical protein
VEAKGRRTKLAFIKIPPYPPYKLSDCRYVRPQDDGAQSPLGQLKMVLQQSRHCSLETPVGKGGEPKTISSKVGSIGSPAVN